MRIDRLELKNFRKFIDKEFDFPRFVDAAPDAGSFYVLIGENAKSWSTPIPRSGGTPQALALTGLCLFRPFEQQHPGKFSRVKDLEPWSEAVQF